MDQTFSPEVTVPFLIVGIAITSVIHGLVLLWVTRRIGIANATWEKCFITSFVVNVVVTLLSYPLRGQMNPVAIAISFVISAVINTILIKLILSTEWKRAFLAFVAITIIHIIIGAIALCCMNGICLPRMRM